MTMAISTPARTACAIIRWWFRRASIGTELSLAGFARPNSAIELYIAQADPTGFGEGLTYLGTLTEGSPADLDTTTGIYGPANINGLAQGTDNTNRFSFRIAAPGAWRSARVSRAPRRSAARLPSSAATYW